MEGKYRHRLMLRAVALSSLSAAILDWYSRTGGCSAAGV